MQVIDILEKKVQLLNSTIRVEGYFVMIEDSAYMVPTKKWENMAVAIEIILSEDIRAILTSTVPIYIGGKAIYNDQAILEGTLREKKEDDGVQLQDINKFSISRRIGDVYQIL